MRSWFRTQSFELCLAQNLVVIDIDGCTDDLALVEPQKCHSEAIQISLKVDEKSNRSSLSKKLRHVAI